MVRRSMIRVQRSGMVEASVPPVIGRGVQETRPEQRVRRPAQLTIEFVQGSDDWRHAGDGVDAEVGSGSVSGDATDFDLGPHEAAVGDGDGELGRLQDDGGVGDRLI
jgi:hypothetical protein